MTDAELSDPLIAITLRLYAANLDPGQITSILGATPTQAYKLGDAHKLSDGRLIYRKNGVWFLKHESYSTDVDTEFRNFGDKIKHVLYRLSESGLSFDELPGVSESFLDVLIIDARSSGDKAEQVVKLSRGIIKLLADLNLSIEITLHWAQEIPQESR